jgi:hypothetical protein
VRALDRGHHAIEERTLAIVERPAEPDLGLEQRDREPAVVARAEPRLPPGEGIRRDRRLLRDPLDPRAIARTERRRHQAVVRELDAVGEQQREPSRPLLRELEDLGRRRRERRLEHREQRRPFPPLEVAPGIDSRLPPDAEGRADLSEELRDVLVVSGPGAEGARDDVDGSVRPPCRLDGLRERMERDRELGGRALPLGR